MPDGAIHPHLQACTIDLLLKIETESEKSIGQFHTRLHIAAEVADASGDEPIWNSGKREKFVAYGSYEQTSDISLLMAMVDSELAVQGTALQLSPTLSGIKACRQAAFGTRP